MKIFVTGGAGFIGRHLVKSLLKSGHKVRIYDNLCNSSAKSVSGLVRDGASFVKGDLTNYDILSKSISGYDTAIHLAAQISVQESIKNPQYTRLVNTTGTLTLLRACVENDIRNVIAASTAAVYGEPKRQPISENSPTVPISPYGVSKLVMEYYMRIFSKFYDMNCVSLRLFNVYGEGQSSAYAGVITKFIESVNHSKPLVIFGDGYTTRDFVSVHDVVNAFENTIKRIGGKRGNVYNIASGKYTTINELAKMILSISGKRLGIRHAKPRKGDIQTSRPLITRAKKDLLYHPKIELQKGLKKLLESSF